MAVRVSPCCSIAPISPALARSRSSVRDTSFFAWEAGKRLEKRATTATMSSSQRKLFLNQRPPIAVYYSTKKDPRLYSLTPRGVPCYDLDRKSTRLNSSHG